MADAKKGVDVKDEQSEGVRQRHRIASGAWIEGSEMKEQSKATIAKANSDHGSFSQGKGIDKKNA